jgi:hypothetical protein
LVTLKVALTGCPGLGLVFGAVGALTLLAASTGGPPGAVWASTTRDTEDAVESTVKAALGVICAPFTVEKVPVTLGCRLTLAALTMGNVSPMVGDE